MYFIWSKVLKMSDFDFFPHLQALVADAPTDSIISRTFLRSERVNAILFSFAAGQELSEHTAAHPAILHFLSGEAQLTLGDQAMMVQAGAWAHMPANLPHSILAHTPVIMLLLLLKA